MQAGRRRYLRWALTPWWWGGNFALAQALAKPKTVVVEIDLSTRSRDAAAALLAGVQAAFDSANPALQVQIVNTYGNPMRARDALEQIASQSALVAVVGGADANVAAVVGPWAQAQQLPYAVLWSSVHAQQSRAAWDFYFGLSDAQCLQRIVEKPLAKKRWGFLFSNDVLGRASYEALLELLTNATQLEPVGIQWHDVAANEIAAQYWELANQGAQGIWLSAYPRASAILAQALRSNRAPVPRPPVCASANAWSAQWASTTRSALQDAPLYFALPQLPTLHRLPAHPAGAWARALGASLVASVRTHAQADLQTLRAAVAQGWRATQTEFANLPFGFYGYRSPAGLQEFSLAQILNPQLRSADAR